MLLYSVLFIYENNFYCDRDTNVLCYTNELFSMLSEYHVCAEKHSPGKSHMMDLEALVKAYPLMSFKDTKSVGCVDQSAGVLYAERCLQAFQVRFLMIRL